MAIIGFVFGALFVGTAAVNSFVKIVKLFDGFGGAGVHWFVPCLRCFDNQHLQVNYNPVNPLSHLFFTYYVASMNEIARFTFETAYRQLAQADRAFVDDFVARIEQVYETTGRDLFEILGSIDYDTLSERDQGYLAKSIVRAAVSERVKDIKEAQNVNPRRIVKEFATLAFTTLNDFFDPEAPTIADAFDLRGATPEQRAAIKEVEVEESARTGRIKVKFKLHDRMAPLRELAKIAGLYDQDGEVVNRELWAAEGAIPSTATVEDLADEYQKMISNES